MKYLIVSLALIVGLACSVSIKQAVSSAHLAARSAVTVLDDAEFDACKPDVTTLHCTAVPRVITDAAHVDFNRRITAFYTHDKVISRLIVDWKPNAPVPADLTSAITEAEKFLTDAQTLAPSLTAKVSAVLEHFRDLARKWIGGDQWIPVS